jgi:hypothetical protein
MNLLLLHHNLATLLRWWQVHSLPDVLMFFEHSTQSCQHSNQPATKQARPAIHEPEPAGMLRLHTCAENSWTSH